MSQDSSRASLFELTDSLLKSWWTIVAGICLGLAGSIAALQHLPKVYVASTKIRIAPQSVPEDFVRTTVTDDMTERLIDIQEAILSRDYLDQLITHNFGMPATEQEREDLMRALRDRVDVDRRHESRICTLYYEDTDPARAARVINELTDLYVQQNKDFRSTQAESTREEFDQMASVAKQELDAAEREVNEFLTQHRFATADFRDSNLQLLDTRSRDVETNRREQNMARMRLTELTARAEQSGWLAPPTPGAKPVTADPRARRVQELRRELADLRGRYEGAHPQIQRAESELERLEGELLAAPAQQGTEVAIAEPIDPQRAASEVQISAARQELADLQARELALRREIGEIERRLELTPRLQADLSNLQERRRILDERYRDLSTKAERARSSEFLEQTDRGQRIEIVERAEIPQRPDYPEPLQIYGIGIMVGCVVFIGPLVLRNLLNPVVLSEAGLRGLIDVPVLVAIPRIETGESVGSNRRQLARNLTLSLLSTAVLGVVVALEKFALK